VLDPVAQAERTPDLRGRLEGVEGLAVGPIADRVDGDRPAGRGRSTDDLSQFVAARDPYTRSVQHPGGLRTERAVHEALQVAEPEKVVAEPGPQPEVGKLRHFVGGQ
jgi:hypothetical protein